MKAYINRQLIEQTSLDSGALTMLAAIVHNFPEPGVYHGAATRGKETSATFQLTVDEKSTAMQVNIDLATLNEPAPEGCGCQKGEHDDTRHFIVNPRGQAVFYVSKGPGGYAVAVNRVNEKRVLFDSRQLTEGDLFAATLIRPGTYSVTNASTNARGEVNVAFLTPSKTAYRPPDPVTIEATQKGLVVIYSNKDSGALKLELQFGQGQLYRIRTPSRIQIQLTKPNDGPQQKEPQSLVSWRKPSAGIERPVRTPPLDASRTHVGAKHAEERARKEKGRDAKRGGKK
jgi:hypothetical protein